MRLAPNVQTAVDRWVARQSERFAVSKSFVVEVAIAEVAGIELEYDYRTETVRLRHDERMADRLINRAHRRAAKRER